MSTSVGNAISYRIGTQHVELIRIYGLEAVMEEIDEQASFVGDVEEIGSSDISCWVNSIRKRLAHRVMP